MAGQSVARREIVRSLAIAAGVAAFPGFSKWSFACGHPQQSLQPIRPSAYQPIFLSAHEYALIERLTDIIIPRDETPGARDAGVAEFIDLMTSRDVELQHDLRAGLIWLNKHSETLYRAPFLQLSPEQQSALLAPLAYKKKFRRGEKQGRDFFDAVREYTIMGFYTSEIGLKELNFPGFQFYAESPACPHKDDPGHLHLPPPKVVTSQG